MNQNEPIFKVEDHKVETVLLTEERPRRKMKVGQLIFCLISFLFILSCFFFYGNRLIKYYKIYNPKMDSGEAVDLLSNAIMRNSPIVYGGSGVYRENGLYVYKGKDANNYIRFSNLLWRIIRTNSDGSLEIVLAESYHSLAYDFDQQNVIDSDLFGYLNDEFVTLLNKDYLKATMVCEDTFDAIEDFQCDTQNYDYYVKILPINEFLNSFADGTSYMVDDSSLLWLGSFTDSSYWHTNGVSISLSEGISYYGVKPVVTIKNSAPLLSGSGTLTNPYIIESSTDTMTLGSYIKIEEDTWIVIEQLNDRVKLVSANLYNQGQTTHRFDLSSISFDPTRESSLAYYLNTTFYESLSYKEKLLDFDLEVGAYQSSYQSIKEQTVSVKVGIPTITDMNIDPQNGYYLATSDGGDRVFYYQDGLMASKPTITRPFRPVIIIKKETVKSGTGIKTDPYVLEV